MTSSSSCPQSDVATAPITDDNGNDFLFEGVLSPMLEYGSLAGVEFDANNDTLSGGILPPLPVFDSLANVGFDADDALFGGRPSPRLENDSLANANVDAIVDDDDGDDDDDDDNSLFGESSGPAADAVATAVDCSIDDNNEDVVMLPGPPPAANVVPTATTTATATAAPTARATATATRAFPLLAPAPRIAAPPIRPAIRTQLNVWYYTPLQAADFGQRIPRGLFYWHELLWGEHAMRRNLLAFCDAIRAQSPSGLLPPDRLILQNWLKLYFVRDGHRLPTYTRQVQFLDYYPHSSWFVLFPGQ